MSGRKLVVGLAASIASVAASSHIASAQVSIPALIVNAETSVMSRPAARSDVIEVVPPETVLEVIGHEGDWDWVILPPDVNGTRWIQTRGLTPEKKLQLKQEREAAQRAKEEQAQLKQEEAQRLKEDAQRQKEEQARLKQEQIDKQKQDEAQKQAAKDEEQRMAKAKRDLEKARRDYEKAAGRGTPTQASASADESTPVK
jgi:uncharacterized protein YgiM (DUF1202 family)